MLNPSLIECTTSSQRKLMSRIISNFYHSQQYSNKQALELAVTKIDLAYIYKLASESKGESYQDEIIKALLSWFKRKFFRWQHKPKCKNSDCVEKKSKSKAVGRGMPNNEEKRCMASVVELYQCENCKEYLRYPRYNLATKLLETRYGRCGEFANCFCLIAASMGFDVRFVVDWTDHVWAEIYSVNLKRWIHCDCCEVKFDKPMMYESGWKKKISFILAFNREGIWDVTKRYSRKWNTVLERRRNMGITEEWFNNALQTLNSQIQIFITPQRMAIIKQRNTEEIQEFSNNSDRELHQEEKGGRISGDTQWKKSRGEFVEFNPNNYELISFKTGNTKGILKKIKSIYKTINNELKFNSDIENVLSGIVSLYEDKSLLYKSSEYDDIIFGKLLKYPQEKLFPIIDILRLILLNKNVSTHFVEKKLMKQLIEFILSVVFSGNNKNNQFVSMRLLTNMILIDEELMLSRFEEIFDKSISKNALVKKKGVILSLLFNYSLKIYSDENRSIRIVIYLSSNFDKFYKDGNDLERKQYVNILGILCFNNAKIQSILKNLFIKKHIKGIKVHDDKLIGLISSLFRFDI